MRVSLCTVASASHLHLIRIFCPNSGMGTDAPTPFPTGLVATKAHLYLSNPSPDPNPDPDPDPNPNQVKQSQSGGGVHQKLIDDAILHQLEVSYSYS